MSKNPRVRGQEGFTLVESMIAMFFLAYIVGQMAMVSIYSSHSAQNARDLTRANFLAEEAVDKSRNIAYNSLQLAIDFTYKDTLGNDYTVTETCVTAGTVVTCTSAAPYTPDKRGKSFTRVRIVSPLPSGTTLASSDQADVGVTVSYPDTTGATQSVQVASVVSRL